MLIDIHTHAFPDAIAPGAVKTLLANTVRYAHRYGEGRHYTDGTAGGLAVSSRAAGLDYSVVLPITTSPKPSQSVNSFAAYLNAEVPGLLAAGSVHPLNPEWEAELERAASLGLRGIKLHPEYQELDADDPAFVAVVRKAGALGLWVLLHAGVDIGFPDPLRSGITQIRRLREGAPDTVLILAHLGGYRMWEGLARALPPLDVYLDTAYCFPGHEGAHADFAAIIRAVGSGRVLLGTDTPWRDQRAAVDAVRAFLRAHGFTPDEQAAILGGTAAGLLGVGG